jgi:hypothetical protein
MGDDMSKRPLDLVNFLKNVLERALSLGKATEPDAGVMNFPLVSKYLAASGQDATLFER